MCHKGTREKEYIVSAAPFREKGEVSGGVPKAAFLYVTMQVTLCLQAADYTAAGTIVRSLGNAVRLLQPTAVTYKSSSIRTPSLLGM
jgi:hypothetical protein